MDTSSLDLHQILRSGPYDEAGLNQVKRLLGGQRRVLRSHNDLAAFEQLIALLQDWADAAGGGWLSASALAEAAEIAEIELRNSTRAEQLRSQAIAAGRAASGLPAASPESVAMEGAIDANAELLHELKTMPPGALTQTFVTDDAPEEATEEIDDADLARESSIPRPNLGPPPAPRAEARRPRTLHGYIAPRHEDGSLVQAEPSSREAEPTEDADRRSSTYAAQRGEIEARRPVTPAAGAVGLDERTVNARGGRLDERRAASSINAAQGGESDERGAAAGSEDASRQERRSTPVPTLLGESAAQEFPARLRSTPPPALRAVTEPRRSSSGQPRLANGAAAAASQALRPSLPTMPLRLQPQLSVSQRPANLQDEHTEEVHTTDLELQQTLSMPPLSAAEPADDDALSTQIAQAEQSLESDASSERVRELAELYAKRDARGDRQRAADLYCTLGEQLGGPAGIPMLERALTLVPDHPEAKALLTRYAVRPRVGLSSPKITVLGMPPKISLPMPPPPAAAGAPPMAAGVGAVLPQAADAAHHSEANAEERATLPGTGPTNDVLPLYGVPQVVTTPPAVPQISSLSPIVRSDASELQEHRLSAAKRSYVALGGIALSAAAALALYLTVGRSSQGGQPPTAASGNSAQTTAASRPVAEEPGAAAATGAAKRAGADESRSGAAATRADRAGANKPGAAAAANGVDRAGADRLGAVAAANGVDRAGTDRLGPAAAANGVDRAGTGRLGPAAAANGVDRAGADRLGAAAAANGVEGPTEPAGGADTLAPGADSAAKRAGETEKSGPAAAVVKRAGDAEKPSPAAAAAAGVESAARRAAEADKPAPVAPVVAGGGKPARVPTLKLESAQLRGGKLNETQLTAALGKAEPKLLACYEQAIEKKPRMRGSVIYGFTVRTNGRAANIKRAGGTLRDPQLVQCSVKVLETVRFPKPRKAVQVKLPIQYKRS